MKKRILVILLLRIRNTTETPIAQERESALDAQSSQELVTASKSVKVPSEEEAKERFLKAFNTPIEFYGRVVDENEAAIPEATINFIITNRAFQDGSKQEGFSDDEGLFALQSNGAAVVGYYATEQSRGVFRYVMDNCRQKKK